MTKQPPEPAPLELFEEEMPPWLADTIRACQVAKAGIFAALPPEQREFALHSMKTKRARAIARKANNLAMTRRILELLEDGNIAREIGAELGRSANAITLLARARGISIPPVRPSYRVSMGMRHRDALKHMAADCGSTPVQVLEELIKHALEEDAFIARRDLRVPSKVASVS